MFKKYIETGVGLFMMAGLMAFIVLSFKVSGLTQYQTTAACHIETLFDNIGGLKIRAPVRVAGVRIGEVGNITLDGTTYRAHVTLLLTKNGCVLPGDTAASILTEGLLGANYISLTPGFEKEALKDIGRIEETHSAIILENMISHFLFSLNNKDQGKSSATSSTTSNKPKPVKNNKVKNNKNE